MRVWSLISLQLAFLECFNILSDTALLCWCYLCPFHVQGPHLAAVTAGFRGYKHFSSLKLMWVLMTRCISFQCCEGKDSSDRWQGPSGSCVQSQHALQVECPAYPDLTPASKPVGKNNQRLHAVTHEGENTKVGVSSWIFILVIFPSLLNHYKCNPIHGFFGNCSLHFKIEGNFLSLRII